MKIIEFTLIVTPPLTDTVSGEMSVFNGLPYVVQDDIVIFPRNTKESERANRLGIRSDYGVIIFQVDEAVILKVCLEIANRILSKENRSKKKILVEGVKDDAVISLENVDAKNLSDQIYKTVISRNA